MAREKAAKEDSSSDLPAATSSQFLPFARSPTRSGSPIQSRFPAPARREWSARDFRERNTPCDPAPGPLSPSSHPTYGSSLWKFSLLLDETAHAHSSQFLLRPTGVASEAVRPS